MFMLQIEVCVLCACVCTAVDAISLFNRCKAGLKPDGVIMVRQEGVRWGDGGDGGRVWCASVCGVVVVVGQGRGKARVCECLWGGGGSGSGSGSGSGLNEGEIDECKHYAAHGALIQGQKAPFLFMCSDFCLHPPAVCIPVHPVVVFLVMQACSHTNTNVFMWVDHDVMCARQCLWPSTRFLAGIATLVVSMLCCVFPR
jgi:hypothetical protein